MTASCPVMSGSGMLWHDTAKTMAMGLVVNQASATDCTKVMGASSPDAYFKVLCDTSCGVLPSISIFNDSSCTHALTGHTFSFKEFTGEYKCGVAAGSNVTGCTAGVECTTLPVVGGNNSGVSGLRGKTIVGMMAVLLTAMTMI